MSIEKLLQEHIAAMRELTAALNAMRHTPAVAVVPEAPATLTVTPAPATPAPVAASTEPKAPEPAQDAKPEPTPEVAPPTQPAAPVPEKPIALSDVKPLFVKLAAADRAAAVALLAEFGCAKLTEMKPEQFADFHARLVAA